MQDILCLPLPGNLLSILQSSLLGPSVAEAALPSFTCSLLSLSRGSDALSAQSHVQHLMASEGTDRLGGHPHWIGVV